MKEDSILLEKQNIPLISEQGEKKQRKMNMVRNQLKTKLLVNISQNKINKLYQSRQQQEELKNLKQKQFYQNFIIGEKIGEGTTAVVKNCKLSPENNFLQECKDELVIKIIKYKDIEYFFEILKETIIHKSLNHSNIPKLIDSHVDNKLKSIYIVMQKARGQSLFKYLQQKKQIKEKEAYQIILQLLETFQYLHSKNIVHRDLSLDNVIYDPKQKQIKVIDFSVAKEIKNSTVKLWTQTGKIQYLAPEIFQLDYDHRIDIWSIGVIFYTLLTGVFPFSSQDDCEIQVMKNIQKRKLYLEQYNLSASCQNLLLKMLEKDPKQRISITQALNHPWFQEIQLSTIQENFHFIFSPKKERFLCKHLNLSITNTFYNKQQITNQIKTLDSYEPTSNKRNKKKSQNYICTSFTTLNNMNSNDEVLIQDFQEELLAGSDEDNLNNSRENEENFLGKLNFLKKKQQEKIEKTQKIQFAKKLSSPKNQSKYMKQILKFDYEIDENEEKFEEENDNQLTQESEQKE